MAQKIRYSKMFKHHASGVADVYLSSFNGFLAGLGRTFLTLYYREYCNHKFHFPVVAVELDEDNSRVVGFIIGTTNLLQHYKQFYFKHFFTIGSIFIYKLLTNKSIRSSVLERGVAKKILRTFLSMIRRPSSRASIKGIRRQNSVFVMFTVVHKEFRGTSVAENLQDFFEKEIKDAGIYEGRLSVNLHNVRGMKFYEKTGWTPETKSEREKIDKNRVYYIKRYLQDS